MKKFLKMQQSQKKKTDEEASRNLSFKMDIFNGIVDFSKMLAKYVDCKNHQMTYNDFMSMIPTDEYSSIYRIHQMLLIFFNTQKELRYKCTFILIHKINTKRGRKIKFLRELYFVPQDKKIHIPICQNNCVDITNVHFTNEVTIDINLPERLQHRKMELMERFKPILRNKTYLFSDRELEVLRMWEKIDTIDNAANKLGISKRTIQVHLKNMRRKLQVKRSMDVVLYAKEKGWI